MLSSKLSLMLVFLAVIVCKNLHAQTTGEISGKVVSRETGEALVGVNVLVVGTKLGDATHIDGTFLVRNVPTGVRTVRFSMVGYKSIERSTVVQHGQIARLEVSLTSTVLEFESVVVTATRAPSLVTDVSTPTELITATKIARMNAQSVAKILNTSAGVFVKDIGDRGGLKTISIRGSSTSQVLVLYDGQRISPASGAGIDFSTLTTDNIDWIEVVRGGNSALYGADANGGIVNIISKSGRNTQRLLANGKVTVGSFGSRGFSANVGQQIGRLDYYASFHHTETDDYRYLTLNTKAEQTMENSNFNSNGGSLKLGLQMTEDSKVVLSGVTYREAEGSPGSLSFRTPLATLKSDWQYVSGTYTSKFDPWIENKLQVYHNRTMTDYQDPGGFVQDPSISEDFLTGVELQQRMRVTSGNVLTYGYNYRHELVDGTDVKDRHRDEHGVFLQLESEWHISESGLLNAIRFIPACRYDRYSDFGSNVSPKIGLVLSHTSKHRIALRSNVGTSFRAPGFFDLYWPASAFYRGNPDLRAEESIDFDSGVIGVLGLLGGLEYEVTYYYSRLKNEIMTAPDPAGVFTPQNLGKSKRAGVETRLAFSPWPMILRIEGNYTYLRATDETERSPNLGKILVYRPSHIVNATVWASYGVLDLNFVYHYVDRRYTQADNSAALGGYSYLEGNLAAKYDRGTVEYFARLEFNNLSDRAFQVLDGFPVPKRSVGATVGMKF